MVAESKAPYFCRPSCFPTRPSGDHQNLGCGDLGDPAGGGGRGKGAFLEGTAQQLGLRDHPRPGPGHQSVRGLEVRDEDRTATYPRTATESPPRRGRRSACRSAGPALAPAQPPGLQPRSSTASAVVAPPPPPPPPGIFSPRPLLRSAPSPCLCGDSAGGGGRGARSAPEPPACPQTARAWGVPRAQRRG